MTRYRLQISVDGRVHVKYLRRSEMQDELQSLLKKKERGQAVNVRIRELKEQCGQRR